MADSSFYGIRVGVTLNQNDIKMLGQQLDQVVQKYNGQNITINVNDGNSANIQNITNTLGMMTQALEQTVTKVVSTFKSIDKETGNTKKIVTTLRDSFGQLTDIVQIYNKEGTQVVSTTMNTKASFEQLENKLYNAQMTLEGFSGKMQSAIAEVRQFGSPEQNAQVDSLVAEFQKLDVATAKTDIELKQITASGKTLSESIMAVGSAVTQEIEANRKRQDAYDKLNQKMVIAKQKMQDLTDTTAHFGTKIQNVEMDRLNKEFQELKLNSDLTEQQLVDFGRKMDLMQTKMNGYAKNVKAAGKGTLKLGDMIKTAAKAFTVWISVTAIWFMAMRKIKEGIQTVVEFDSAMLEVNKVMDLTSYEMQYLTDQAYELGDALARTGIEVVKATADFGRMGFSLRESLDLAEQALLLLNIGDGIENVDTATKALIATLKGFDMAASNSAHIVDALNEVSNNFAVDTEDLAQGIRRAAAVLAQSNTTFEESIGLLTAATEVIQDAEKAATGIRTISQRLRSLNEEGEYLGQYFIPKLQEAFETIAGVDIMRDGELRSTYDILKDTAAVWDDLSQQQQQYLGELAAGKRRINIFNAVMSNQGTLLEATDAALNSNGSALRENEKYYDSIEGKIQRFNSTVQTMWLNFINSDTLKGIIDLGRGIITVIDKVGLLTAVFVTLIIALTAFNKLGLRALFIKIATAMGSLISPTLAEAGAMATLGTATTATTVAMTAFGAVVTLGLVVGLLALVNKLQKTKQATEEAAQATEMYISSLKDGRNALIDFAREHDTWLNNLDPSKIDDMRKALDRYSQSMTIFDVFGGIQSGTTENIKDVSESFKELLSELNTYEFEKMGDILDDFLGGKTLQEASFKLGELERQFDKISDTKSNYYDELAQPALSKEISLLKNSIELYKVYRPVYEAVRRDRAEGNDLVEEGNHIYKDYEDSLKAIQKRYSLGLINVTEYRNAVRDLFVSTKKMADEGVEIFDEERLAAYHELLISIDKEVVDGYGDQIDILDSLHDAQILTTDDYIRKLKALRDSNIFTYLGKSTAELAKNSGTIAYLLADDRIAPSLNQYLDIINAIREATEKTKEETEDLVDVYGDLADAAQENKDAMQDLLDMTVDMIKQGYENAIDALEAQTDEYEKQVNLQKEKLNLIEKEHDYQRELADKTKSIGDLEAEIAILARDDSLDAKAKRLELEEQLAKEKDDLAEFQHDRTIELTEDALDQELERFKNVQDEKIAVLEEMLDQQGRLYAEAIDMLNNDFINGTNIVYQGLLEWNRLYGDSIDENITAAWTRAQNAASQYGSGLGFMGAFNAAGDAAILASMQENSLKWKPDMTDMEKSDLHSRNVSLATGLSKPAIYNPASGRWTWADSGVPLYGKGAYVDRPHMAMVGDKKEVILPMDALAEVVNDPSALKRVIPNMTGKIASSVNGAGRGDITIGSIVTVQGNVDKDVMADLKTFSQHIIDSTLKQINNSFANRGQVKLRSF